MKYYFLSILIVFSVSPLAAQQTIQTRPFQSEWEYRTLDENSVIVKRKDTLTVDSLFLVVPENRQKEQTRHITLPVIRIRATQRTDNLPVFWLSGGPGQTNVASFRYGYFIAQHDHVMVGYRGVDGEVSLDCPEVVQVLEDADDILAPETIQKVSEAYGAGAQRLAVAGVDINGYTPLAVADDLEDARKALGYSSIDIIAESYGTRVALLYAFKYPQHVNRMILIGTNPPGCMVWDPKLNDSLLVRYGNLWKQDPEAVGRYPDLVDAFRKVNQNFPKRWLFFPIHEGTVKASANAFLFHRETAVQVFDAYIAAADGDASGLWLFSFIGARIFPTIVNWGDNASKAASVDFDSTRDYYHELNPPNALFGAPLGAFLWGGAQARTWPIDLIPAEYRQARQCSVSTLFLNGSLDFSTPAENTERDLMPNFPNGHHVVVREAGHILDLWQSQPAGTHRLVTSFIETGSIDTSLIRYSPVSFEATRSFPALAKIAVVGVTVAILLIAYLIWWGARKIF